MGRREDVAHLLRRATFGPTAAEVDAAEQAGPAATLDALLWPAGTDTGAKATPIPKLGPDPYLALPKNPGIELRLQANGDRRDQVRALQRWWLDRMVAARHQFTEKLVFFWHGHWATGVQKVRSAPLMLAQLETLRRDGRGDFGALTRAMLRDPALIVWLDGHRNTRQAPNENLARELMELFTLGVGNYTEDDVKAGARALSGWTFDLATGTASLAERRHDAGAKTILGETADFGADSYAELLLRQPVHPAFLARRFWFRFASTDPVPEPAATRLAAAYSSTRNITALVHGLFTDEAFPTTRGQLVKQPVEWVVGALRQLGLTLRGLSKEHRQLCMRGLQGLGQVVLAPPSVAGWPAAGAWLTTSTLRVRLALAAGLADAAPAEVLDQLAAGSIEYRVQGLARLLAVDAWTDRTLDVLTDAATEPRRLLMTGLASPEYAVC